MQVVWVENLGGLDPPQDVLTNIVVIEFVSCGLAPLLIVVANLTGCSSGPFWVYLGVERLLFLREVKDYLWLLRLYWVRHYQSVLPWQQSRLLEVDQTRLLNLVAISLLLLKLRLKVKRGRLKSLVNRVSHPGSAPVVITFIVNW